MVYFMIVAETRSELRKFGYKRMWGARDFGMKEDNGKVRGHVKWFMSGLCQWQEALH